MHRGLVARMLQLAAKLLLLPDKLAGAATLDFRVSLGIRFACPWGVSLGSHEKSSRFNSNHVSSPQTEMHRPLPACLAGAKFVS